MTTIGFVILVLLFLLGIWVYVELARLPGRKAQERGHPQAEAINVLSWIGLLLGVVPWVVALVWAYMKPVGAAPGQPALATPEGPATEGRQTQEEPDSGGPALAT